MRRHIINNQINKWKSLKGKIYTEKKNYMELYYRKQWRIYSDDAVIKGFSDEATLMLKSQGWEKAITEKSWRTDISESRNSKHEGWEGKDFKVLERWSCDVNGNMLSVSWRDTRGLHGSHPPLIYLKQCLTAPLRTLNKSRVRTNMSPKIWGDFCHMEYNVTGNYSSLIFKEKMYSSVTRCIGTDD